VKKRIWGCWLIGGALALAARGNAFDLPASCGTPSASVTAKTPLRELRRRLEAVAENDPDAAVRLMCETIPRVAREKGEHSEELAWWAASLATPLIAYMNKFQEAIPLLTFAEPILEQHPNRYAAEIADIHVAYAWIYFRQGRLGDSGAAWQQALEVREHSPGLHQIELQKVLVGLALVRLGQRDFAATHVALDRATAILRANHAAVSEAAAAIENVQTNLALREENYQDARAHAETQISIEKQLAGGAPQLVPAYVLLGTIYERLDDFDAAEKALREAIRLAESTHGPLQRHYLTALNQIASLLNERDRPREAMPFARRALEVGESTLSPDAPKLVGILRTLAEVDRASGELPQALHVYQRASAIIERSRADIERQVLVAHYRGLGNLELELGDPEAARAALTSGLDAAEDDPTLRIERGYVLLALARTNDATDPERRQRLEQALALFQSRLPSSHPLNLSVINELCAVEIAARAQTAPRCREAGDWIVRARDVAPTLRSAVYRNESELDERRNDAAGAYAQALQALAAAEAVGTPEPLWRAYFTLASALRQRQEIVLAIFFGKQAVSQIERLRGDFIGSDRPLERTFLIDKVSVYRAVADWLMEAGRIDEGLAVVRLLKGEELYDFELRGGPAAADSHVDLTNEERLLKDRYQSALNPAGALGEEFDRLCRLRESDRLSPAERTRLDEMLDSEASKDATRLDRIQAFLSTGEAAEVSPDVRMRSIQAGSLTSELRRAGPDAAIAIFLLTQNRLRILVATHEEELEYELPVDTVALQRDIGRFLAAISRREEVTAASRALYTTVARPVDLAAQRAHAKRLVLWLDGALRYLPFAALNDGSRYLVDKYALQTYSIVDAQPAANRKATQTLSVRGMGVTQAVAGFNALPAIADELCDVVRGPISGLTQRGSACTNLTTGNGALPGEGFADGAFTEARFRSVLQQSGDYSVLHIGTHFSLRPGNTMRSYLVLGDGTKLSLDSISKLSFSGIDLVTLSACQTGLGSAVSDDGREIEGLSAIVRRGGARQVIASLWQVEDKSTAALMRRMYELLNTFRGDGARSLQQSQLSLRALTVSGRRPYEHPFYWAGFETSAR
jgi:CHAT domain-containing protein